MKQPITLNVNGDDHQLYIESSKTLVDVLREDLGLTGTKAVCGLGACGACTVLIDDRPMLACLILAIACGDKKIETIEGLKQGEDLHPLQESFVENGAIQCGMCTPAMILTGKALLDENPNPTEKETREAISGNLCRCTGYTKIVEAIVNFPDKERSQAGKRDRESLKNGPVLMPESGE